MKRYTVSLSVLIMGLFILGSVAHSKTRTIDANYCLYSLENKTDGSINLLDLVESGLAGSVKNTSDVGNFSIAFQGNAFFANKDFTNNIVNKLNEIYLQVPELAQHLSYVILHTVWVMEEEPFPQINCNRNLDGNDSPLDLKRDFIAVPVAYETIYQMRDEPSIHIDDHRFRRLSAGAQTAVIFSVAANKYLNRYQYGFDEQLGSPIPHPSLLDGSIKTRKLNSFFFRNSLDGLKMTLTEFLQSHYFKDPRTLRNYNWVDCDTPVEFDPHYMPSLCYKSSAELEKIKAQCKEVEAETQQILPLVMSRLDIINRTVVEEVAKITGQNDAGKYRVDGEVYATRYWSPTEVYLSSLYPAYGSTSFIDNKLMNYAYESLGGGTYFPWTMIKVRSAGLEFTIDWTKILDWSEFRKSAEKIKEIYKIHRETEFRCEVSLKKLFFLRSLEVKGNVETEEAL